MFYTYILKGQNEFYYCGITKNIDKRIIQHNRKESVSTRAYAPFTILVIRSFESRSESRILEKIIKNTGVKKWYNKNYLFSK